MVATDQYQPQHYDIGIQYHFTKKSTACTFSLEVGRNTGHCELLEQVRFITIVGFWGPCHPPPKVKNKKINTNPLRGLQGLSASHPTASSE